jgi:enoyl-CoA hydratase/carnithine racemase
MKQLLHDGLEQPVETALRAELVMSDVHRRSNDNRVGVRAFKEKRRPEFDGT